MLRVRVMTRVVLCVVGLVLSVVWGMGCGTAPCQSDVDCLAEQSCVVGVCQDACQEEGDCQSGGTCRAGKCRQTCINDRDCVGDESCEAGACIVKSQEPQGESTSEGGEPTGPDAKPDLAPDTRSEPPVDKVPDVRPECKQDSDCPPGKVCQRERCLKGSPNCQPQCRIGDLRCTGGQVQTCEDVDGCGKWGSTTPCPSGATCVAGTCARTCTKNSDCPSRQHCGGGTCAPCQDKCTINATRCVGEAEVKCSEDNGCGVWDARGRTCPAGQLCKSGACAAGCQRDSQCPKGKLCIGGFCVAGCQSDSECTGYKCQARQCATSCSTDSACQTGAGYRCVEKACVKVKTCQRDPECPAGFACKSGICLTRCQGALDCQLHFLCSSGKCKPSPTCTDSSTCQTGYRCDARLKRCNNRCTSLGHCEDNYTCQKGACKPRTCSNDSQCRVFVRCVGGVCKAKCSTNADCTIGYQCTQSKCVAQARIKEGGLCNDPGAKCAGGLVCIDFSHGAGEKRCLKYCGTASRAFCPSTPDSRYTCRYSRGSATRPISGVTTRACFFQCVSDSMCRRIFGSSAYCSSTRNVCVSQRAPGGTQKKDYEICVSSAECASGYTCMNTSNKATNTKRCMKSCTSSSQCSSGWTCLYPGGASTGTGTKGCFYRCSSSSSSSTCHTKTGDFAFCSSAKKACITESDPDPGKSNKEDYHSCTSTAECASGYVCIEADKSGSTKRCMRRCGQGGICRYSGTKCLYARGATTGTGDKVCYNGCNKNITCYSLYSSELTCQGNICIR